MFIFGGGVSPDVKWFSAGLASALPDTASDEGENLANLRPTLPCEDVSTKLPGCKVFSVPKEDPSKATEVSVTETDFEASEAKGELKDQVLVFQYRGKFHAVDHKCPHSSYPLSQGVPYDIEDFGVVLSAGVMCPKHGWSFDLFTGTADRANYKLTVWEVHVRDTVKGTPGRNVDKENGPIKNGEADQKTVWVRRKQRIG